MEQLNNFIITASPRSGTKFLAQLMDKSKEFTVMHDRGIGYIKRNKGLSHEERLESIKEIIHQENYGEVSGNHRAFINDYDFVGKKGFIIRHPYKCMISEANMNPSEVKKWTDRDIRGKFERLDQIAQNVDLIISFEKMTSNVEYLKEVLEYFGITDVKVDKDIISRKVNKRAYKYKTLNDFPSKIKDKIINETDWYAEKYKLKLI